MSSLSQSYRSNAKSMYFMLFLLVLIIRVLEQRTKVFPHTVLEKKFGNMSFRTSPLIKRALVKTT